MRKTATDTLLSGPTMGTTWQVRLDDAPADPLPLHAALQTAVSEVDDQMSTWKADSALMPIGAMPKGAAYSWPKSVVAIERFDVSTRIRGRKPNSS